MLVGFVSLVMKCKFYLGDGLLVWIICLCLLLVVFSAVVTVIVCFV